MPIGLELAREATDILKQNPTVVTVYAYGSIVEGNNHIPTGDKLPDVDLCVTVEGDDPEDSIATPVWLRLTQALQDAGITTGWGFHELHLETLYDVYFRDPQQLADIARRNWVGEVKEKGILLYERSSTI